MVPVCLGFVMYLEHTLALEHEDGRRGEEGDVIRDFDVSNCRRCKELKSCFIVHLLWSLNVSKGCSILKFAPLLLFTLQCFQALSNGSVTVWQSVVPVQLLFQKLSLNVLVVVVKYCQKCFCNPCPCQKLFKTSAYCQWFWVLEHGFSCGFCHVDNRLLCQTAWLAGWMDWWREV